ncbi:MAG: DegT/DnrJ/EryC1/StrS family aminotransferase [Deltaproteobacteria bacterium]
MEAIVRAPLTGARDSQRAQYLPALPTLWPHMLSERVETALPFPFGAESIHFTYFARNAVWAAVRLFGLMQREVLVPAYHHGVEIEALVDAGAVPKFYGIGPDLRLDPEEVLKRIGPSTGAVYVIHYLGFPQPLDELADACRTRGIPLIEDCALALLSSDGDRPLGSRGDASIFCLYKTLPVPNGGALVLNGVAPRGLPRPASPSWASTVSHVSNGLLRNLRLRGGPAGGFISEVARGMGRAVAGGVHANRVATGTQHFDRSNVALGMSPVSARILAAQRYSSIVEARRRNFFFLLGRLRDIAPPVAAELPAGVCPLFFPVAVEDKAHVQRRLAARGVESIDFWRTGHPSVRPGEFPEVERLRSQILELPIHQDLGPAGMDYLASCVREALRG